MFTKLFKLKQIENDMKHTEEHKAVLMRWLPASSDLKKIQNTAHRNERASKRTISLLLK